VDQAQFDTITTFLRGLNTSGSLGSADLDVLKNAILGVFSNTYTPGYIGKSQEQLMSEYAPSFFAVDQTGDPILQEIVNDIEAGKDLWTIKQELQAVLNADQNVTGDSALTTRYMAQADLYYREFNAYKKAETADAQSKIDNDPFRKIGLPGVEDRYNPEEIFAENFAQTAQRFADKRKAAKTKMPIRNPQQRVMQPTSTTSDTSGATTNPVGGELKNIPSSAPQEYVDTATSSISDADKELTAATVAFENFKKNNPDDFGMEYQDKYDRVQNALKNQGQRIDTAVGFTGASSYARNPATGTALNNNKSVSVNQNPYFDRQKSITASGLGSDAENYIMEQLARIFATKLEQEGKTPLKDQLTARGLFAQAAYRPKTTKAANKNYTVKGSNVVKSGS
jgi:hypothetical protein